MPWWEDILEMAEEWGEPPYKVYMECSEFWYDRWKVKRNAKAEGERHHNNKQNDE